MNDHRINDAIQSKHRPGSQQSTKPPKWFESARKAQEKFSSIDGLDGISIPPPQPFPLSDIIENKVKREWELAEASGRLLEKRLDRIDERLKGLQDQLEASDKKAPIRSIWTGAVAGVLTAVASYFVMKYVTMPTTIPFTTPTTTVNSKIEEVSIDYSDY